MALTTPASAPLLTTDQARQQCRVDGEDEDVLLDAYVSAATRTVEERSGRKLLPQTWQATWCAPPFGDILQFPIGPVLSVEAITYYDVDNVEQTFGAANYRLLKDDESAWIETVSGVDWPRVYDRSDAFSVSFVAGYGAASAVPVELVQAARLLVAHWYENRENSAVAMHEMTDGASSLINLSRKGWAAG
ncbi:phage head-tail connector protein [uncultured Roseibium sp.]|uniref:head-tail connector protein n=1 Tax=uncultured Roseibium sp. TaxID=1936171 RepID=UPI00260606DD|nr:phage head-tail connector protein [uncultured Roseibium sp.]